MGADQRGPFGRRGEDLACETLRREGYRVVERRFRTRMGELDIIARDGDTMVFVEVKARSGGSFGTPFESVTWRKRRRLCGMAAEYLRAHRLEGAPCRFDVVGVTEGGGAAPRVEIIRRAFDLDW